MWVFKGEMAAKADAVIATSEVPSDEPRKPRKLTRDDKPANSDTKPVRRSVAKKSESPGSVAAPAAPEKAAVKRVRKPVIKADDTVVAKPDAKE